jgi:predicted transcriptional regulator of viral defense system
MYKEQSIPHHQKFRQFAEQAGSLFSIGKAAEILHSDRTSAAKNLARWHHQGLIARVAPGLYALIPADVTAANFTLEDTWQLIPQLFAPGYVGGWSATEYWDLTEQIFNTLMVFTTQLVPHKQLKIGQQRFELKHVNESRLFGLKPVWRGQEKVMISDMHRTIIDLFDDLQAGAGLLHATDCLRNYLKKPDANLNILNEYAQKINNGALYKRLGFLLQKLMGDTHPIIETFHAKLTEGNSYLDPRQKKQVRLIRHWRLFVPIAFEFEKEI